MLQGVILINALSSTCWEKKEKEKEAFRGFFSRAGGRTCLAGCAKYIFSFHFFMIGFCSFIVFL